MALKARETEKHILAAFAGERFAFDDEDAPTHDDSYWRTVGAWNSNPRPLGSFTELASIEVPVSSQSGFRGRPSTNRHGG